ncbi:AAA family ATPase [Candidatus Gottesmanbacteria bacterium]|nr:AAA family ATPase [Candidatus Gottesmanbacteria bacterium]
MNEPQLIAIVGMPGAGKSTAADFFREKNIPVLRFGDQTDIGLKELGLERNEKNEREYREKLRHDLGMAAMAIKIEPRIRDAAKQADRVVLDGMRSLEEYIFLKEKFPQLKVLCIYASPELRYQRLATRSVRPLTKTESRRRDFAEIQNLNSGGPIAIADYLIKNERSNEHFIGKLEKYHTSL